MLTGADALERVNHVLLISKLKTEVTALKAELAQQTTNTGSPKMADDVLEAIRCVNRGDYESCINVLSGVVGQLRAGA